MKSAAFELAACSAERSYGSSMPAILVEVAAASAAARDRTTAVFPDAPATGAMVHDLGNLLQVVASAIRLIDRRIEQRRYDDLRALTRAASAAIDRAAALRNRTLALAMSATKAPAGALPAPAAGSADEGAALADRARADRAASSLLGDARRARPADAG